MNVRMNEWMNGDLTGQKNKWNNGWINEREIWQIHNELNVAVIDCHVNGWIKYLTHKLNQLLKEYNEIN